MLVSAPTPLILQREEGKAVCPRTAARPSRFCFEAEGQCLPLADQWARRAPLVVGCGHAAEAAALPPAETVLAQLERG